MRYLLSFYRDDMCDIFLSVRLVLTGFQILYGKLSKSGIGYDIYIIIICYNLPVRS